MCISYCAATCGEVGIEMQLLLILPEHSFLYVLYFAFEPWLYKTLLYSSDMIKVNKFIWNLKKVFGDDVLSTARTKDFLKVGNMMNVPVDLWLQVLKEIFRKIMRLQKDWNLSIRMIAYVVNTNKVGSKLHFAWWNKFDKIVRKNGPEKTHSWIKRQQD